MFCIIKFNHDEGSHRALGPFKTNEAAKNRIENEFNVAKGDYPETKVTWWDENHTGFTIGTSEDGIFAEYFIQIMED